MLILRLGTGEDGLTSLERGRRFGVFAKTESGYISYRTQIKQGVESASRPTVEKMF